MLNIIGSSFAHSSSSVYFARFIKSIEEILVTPLSYLEMVVGFVLGGVARALIVGFGILAVGIFFDAVVLTSIWGFLFYVIAISTIFSLLGILIGLWAQGFEQLGSINTFIITPLTYLGGIFYSIHMLPDSLRLFTLSNPFFYFVDGLRQSMIGVSEGNPLIGLAMILFLVISLLLLVLHLLKIGWRIRP